MIYILFIYLLFCCLASAGKQLSLSFCFYEYAIFHNTFLSDFLDVWKIRSWSAFNVASYGLTMKRIRKVNTFIKQCTPGTKVAKEKQSKICTYHFYTITSISCNQVLKLLDLIFSTPRDCCLTFIINVNELGLFMTDIQKTILHPIQTTGNKTT